MRFIKEERGDALIWLVIIVGILLFGFMYGLMDPFMQEMLTQGVESGIPEAQQGIESNVWTYLPLIALLAFAIWGVTESQRRRVI